MRGMQALLVRFIRQMLREHEAGTLAQEAVDHYGVGV